MSEKMCFLVKHKHWTLKRSLPTKFASQELKKRFYVNNSVNKRWKLSIESMHNSHRHGYVYQHRRGHGHWHSKKCSCLYPCPWCVSVFMFIFSWEFWYCSETTLTGESQFHINVPLGIEPGSLMMRRKQVVHWASETWCECSEIAALHRAPPQQPTMSVEKPERGPAASVNLGQKSCVRSSGIIILSARQPSDGRDEACLRRGHNDQSRWGHQCSETMLTGESRFWISIPLEIEPRSLMTWCKQVAHWTSETWCECSEIAGSPQ
jgi:hypothetical protein